MKKVNQFVQDLGESLQIGMKRLLIAMAVILLIVFVGVGVFFSTHVLASYMRSARFLIPIYRT